MDYTINRKLNRTGKHYVYYVTINGKRLTKINYIRKYDARNVMKAAINKYGVNKLNEMFA